MTSLLLFILFFAPLAYFFYFNKVNPKYKDQTKTNKKVSQHTSKSNDAKISDNDNANNNSNNHNLKETIKQKQTDKHLILNSCKESKEINNVFFNYLGKAVLFNDERKFYLLLNSNYLNKSINNLYSKSIENDIISDAAFSTEKNLVVVALKNSKDLIFYELKIDDNTNKLKFFKLENKKIKTERKFDIKKVAITNDGLFAITSGSGQDTQIQIFDIEKAELVKSLDINEIENEDMKITPNSDCITISTSLYDIASVAISVSKKNTKNTNVEEVIVKAEKKNSLSVKESIIFYDFSNNTSYFNVLTKDSKIKIFQSYGSFPDSKCVYEYKSNNRINIDAISCYITSDNSLRLEGYLAYSSNDDIVIINIENNKEEKTILKVLDYSVHSIKLLSQENKLLCLVAFRNGRLSTIDTELKV